MGRRLLQSGTAFLLQSETDVVTKWDRCYKVRRMLLQSGTGVTKCDDCYKVGSNRSQFKSNIQEVWNSISKRSTSAIKNNIKILKKYVTYSSLVWYELALLTYNNINLFCISIRKKFAGTLDFLSRYVKNDKSPWIFYL